MLAVARATSALCALIGRVLTARSVASDSFTGSDRSAVVLRRRPNACRRACLRARRAATIRAPHRSPAVHGYDLPPHRQPTTRSARGIGASRAGRCRGTWRDRGDGHRRSAGAATGGPAAAVPPRRPGGHSGERGTGDGAGVHAVLRFAVKRQSDASVQGRDRGLRSRTGHLALPATHGSDPTPLGHPAVVVVHLGTRPLPDNPVTAAPEAAT